MDNEPQAQLNETNSSQQDNKIKRIILSKRQKEYLKSVSDLSPHIPSLEVLGCGKCDPMIKKLCDPAHTINDGLLEKQVVFKPPKNDQENGKFQFDRIFYETYMSLPSFEKDSNASAMTT